MAGGALPEYIKNNPDADRLRLVGVPPDDCSSHPYPHHQLSDVASGLYYLHSRDVIHGDLKGVCYFSEFRFIAVLILGQSNVLVDADGHARITAFRPAAIAEDVDSEQTILDQRAGGNQWSAPEVLEGGAASKEADIFSLAMVMIEVLHL